MEWARRNTSGLGDVPIVKKNGLALEKKVVKPQFIS